MGAGSRGFIQHRWQFVAIVRLRFEVKASQMMNTSMIISEPIEDIVFHKV